MVGRNARALGLGVLCAFGPALLSGQEPKPRLRPALPGRAAPAAPAPTPATQSGLMVPGSANTELPSFGGCSPVVRIWWKQQAGSDQLGRISCAADPTRPAILLVHGLHQDARTWTAPSSTEYA